MTESLTPRVSNSPTLMLVLCLLHWVPGPLSAQGGTVRDSAGITIVENVDSAWTPETAWIVEDSADVEIGSRFGERGAVFGSIADAARLSDGRFAVADPMNRTVGVFNRFGGFLFAVGGRGEGPAEVQAMGGISVLQGDSFAVLGLRPRKTIYFGPSGEHLRTATEPRVGWKGYNSVSTVGMMPDGSFFATYRPVEADYPQGRAITHSEVHHFDENGTDQGLYAVLPSLPTVNEGPTKDVMVFGPRPSFAADQSGFWFSFPLTYEIRHYSQQGIDKIVRRSWTAVPVPKGLREEYRVWRRAAFDESVPDFVERILRNEPFAESFPAFKRILVSPDGHLWVEEYPTLDEQSPESWDGGFSLGLRPWSVFDPDGGWLGTVIMPDGLRVTEIGSDYVLGIWKDELDVSFVHLHRIVKPEATKP
jgi:hypothetical protein